MHIYLVKLIRLSVVLLMFLGCFAVTLRAASAAVILSEAFEGTFPPAGWTVTNDVGGPVVWHRSDQPPTGQMGATGPSPMSGYYAYAESYPTYCGSSYDTSFITPSFSTMGMHHVEVQFDYQFWRWASESLVLDYRIGAGTWITHLTMPSNGGYAPETRRIDISFLRGNPSVQLRWRYYNLGSGCDWWTSIDNVIVEARPVQPIPTLSEWGMIIFSLLLAGSAIWMIRHRQIS